MVASPLPNWKSSKIEIAANHCNATMKLSAILGQNTAVHLPQLSRGNYALDKIHSILAKALVENLNVIVQCDMGVSRSGAIALFGVEMGFKNVGNCKKCKRLSL